MTALRRLSIDVVIDPARVRRWHVRLATRLVTAGHHVGIAEVPGGPAFPRLVDDIAALERLIHRNVRADTGRAGADALAGFARAGAAADLVVDLTAAPHARAVPVLAPLYDGRPGEESAVAALVAGRVPALAIGDGAAPVTPAVEDRGHLRAALAMLEARAATLILRAVERVAAGETLQRCGAPPPQAPSAARLLAWKLDALARRLTARPPHWFVGWRRVAGAGLAETGAVGGEAFRRLPDDGRRFYADPFALTAGGQTTVFVEEYPFATAKGVVSAVAFGPDGPIGTPRPVLEEAWHLSYPHVFVDGGAVYMVPEASAARRVDLYRAVTFPDRWERVATLIEDADLSDATILRHDGRYYLFAAIAEEGASRWDALVIHTAERLEGPWRRLPFAPHLVDAGAARPAGAFLRAGGALLRPVQDCRQGYGAALAIARVDRLDPEGYAQTVVHRLAPAAVFGVNGLHTLNREGTLELVDGCADRPR